MSFSLSRHSATITVLALTSLALVGTGCSDSPDSNDLVSCTTDQDCQCSLLSGSGECHWFGKDLSKAILSVTKKVNQVWGCYSKDATGSPDTDAAPCCYRQACGSSEHCEIAPREESNGNVRDPRCMRAKGAGIPSDQCDSFIATSGEVIYLCMGQTPSPMECFLPDPVEVLGGNFTYVPDPSKFGFETGQPSDCRKVCSLDSSKLGPLADCSLEELATALLSKSSSSSSPIPVNCKVAGLESAAALDALIPRKYSCDDGNPCTTDTCSETSPQCVSTPLANGATCDLNPLLNDEKCVDSVCVSIPCDDGNPCTTDQLETTGCVYNPSPGAMCANGEGRCNNQGHCQADIDQCPPTCASDMDCSSCQSQNACIGKVTCIDGSCKIKPNSVVACASHPSPCASRVCNPQTGACDYIAAGAACSDQSPCTSSESCDGAGRCAADTKLTANCQTNTDCAQCAGPLAFCLGDAQCGDNGKCEFSPPAPPSELNSGCSQWVCDPNTQTYVSGDAPNGTTCDDNKACTTAEACQAGQCTGTPIDCGDGIGCTVDSCNPTSGCVHEADTTLCDDNNLCTTDTCDPKQDCTYTFTVTPCDDGDACSTEDVCAGGICVGSDTSLKDCDDNDVCTDDSCDTLKGCQNALNVSPCDDSNQCTTNDACANGSCSGVDTSATDCDDNDPCTTDSCDAAEGCKYVFSNTACDDGNACTTADLCNNGTCAGVDTSATDCKDDNACNDDTCDPLIGCQHVVNPSKCDDNEVCTIDSCDPKTGCSYENSTLECDDGNACTTQDQCTDGACSGTDSSAIDCDDKNECTDDSCNPDTGCINANNTASCSDSNACTTNDTCDSGTCVGTDTSASDCDDNTACTIDTCDTVKGCINAPNHQDCKTDETCREDICVSGAGCISKVVPECCSNAAITALPGCAALIYDNSVYQLCAPNAAACDGAVFKGNCYQKFDEALTWGEAQAKCAQWESSGHLVTISNAAEQGVVDYLLGDNYPHTWIGSHNTGCDGYQWVDGSVSPYTNWLCNAAPTEEDAKANPCVVLYDDKTGNCGTKQWMAVPCDFNNANEQPLHYICEKPMGTNWNWLEASAFCENNGYQLAAITSPQENTALTALLTQKGASPKNSAWLGLSDSQKEDVWIWSTNEPTTYTNWVTEEPISDVTVNCAAMHSTSLGEVSAGQWYTRSCDAENIGVICESKLPAKCGNNVVEDGEECDDGNMDDNDGCSANCQSE